MNAISTYDKAAMVCASILCGHTCAIIERLYLDNFFVDKDVGFFRVSFVQDLQELLTVHEVHWIAKPAPEATISFSPLSKSGKEGREGEEEGLPLLNSSE